jgi:hypothetical protein
MDLYLIYHRHVDEVVSWRQGYYISQAERNCCERERVSETVGQSVPNLKLPPA